MPNTYSQIYIHLVFAVKGRQNAIRPEIKERIHQYISGIIKNNKQKLYIINSMPDHVHILISISPDISISNLVREIKSNSTAFIKKELKVITFSWQEGFGAFSCSQSQIPIGIRYIKKQDEHHKKTSFIEEYKLLLTKYNISFDERYIFTNE